MNPDKITNVFSLTPQERYLYFVRKAADFERVWGLLRPDGLWVVSATDSGDAYPFWPEAEFAQVCAVNDWSEAKATAIDLEEFMDQWLPNIHEDGDKVGVFWEPGNLIGVDVDPLVLLKDLQEECSRYQ